MNVENTSFSFSLRRLVFAEFFTDQMPFPSPKEQGTEMVWYGMVWSRVWKMSFKKRVYVNVCPFKGV